MKDRIILSAGIYEKVPVSFLIAYKDEKPVFVDFLDDISEPKAHVGRIERISQKPGGAYIRLEDGQTGFLERKHFESLCFYSRRDGIDRNKHPIIDGDRVYVWVKSPGKYHKKSILSPSEAGDDRLATVTRAYDLRDPEIIDGRADSALAKELNLTLRLDSLISSLLSRRVCLRNGGNILIEENETAVFIDVNSGKADLSHSDAVKFNLEAANTIFEQIRLRHLSGMILVDFLKMKKEDRHEFEGKLRELTAAEKEICFHDLTALGIGEFTVPFSDISLKNKLEEIRKKSAFSVDETKPL